RVRALLDALGDGHPWLRHLLLGTNDLRDGGAAQLGAALGRGLALETVYLGCNVIREPGARALAEGLAANSSVRALWLKRNPIGERGAAALLAALRRPSCHVRTLDVTNCELGDAATGRLIAGLAEARASIEHLFLGGNGLTDPAPLVTWLVDPACPLKSLFLSASRLGDRGLSALAEALSRNTGLRALDVASNGLGPAGLRALAERADRLSITWLNLGASPATAALGERFNALGDAVVPELAKLCGSTLARLGLREAGLTSRGVVRLLAMISSLPTPPNLILGKGIARRLRRVASSLSPQRAAAPRPIRAIASVYR
ncbi:MAG: hypothetical protein KC468_39085, partial [Myxococcales bacterium]|nr:hypothetical protein [Myxococcales bacterium]